MIPKWENEGCPLENGDSSRLDPYERNELDETDASTKWRKVIGCTCWTNLFFQSGRASQPASGWWQTGGMAFYRTHRDLIASSMLETRPLFVTGSIQESRSLQVYYTALHFRCPKTQQTVWYYIKWRPFSRVLLLFVCKVSVLTPGGLFLCIFFQMLYTLN